MPKAAGKRSAISTSAENEPPAAKKAVVTKVKEPQTEVSGYDRAMAKERQTEANFKVVSWNLNGARAVVKATETIAYLKKLSPDVMCFQELKCSDGDIPGVLQMPGYHAYWSYCTAKKGYSGTGLLTKVKPLKVTRSISLSGTDDEGRVICAEFGNFFILNAYVPNSGQGLVRLKYRCEKFEPRLREYLAELREKKPVIYCGDLNVAHTSIDIANPSSNKRSAGYTVEERAEMDTLLSSGFIDSFRHLYPDARGMYSYWGYRANCRPQNVGWRLDYFLLSDSLQKDLCDVEMRRRYGGSDHCPLVLHLKLSVKEPKDTDKKTTK